MFLEVHQKHVARAVHHAFGHPGGARGIEDEQRVVEGKLGELDLRSGAGSQIVVEEPGVHDALYVRRLADKGHHHHVFDAFYLPANLGGLGQAVEGLAVVMVAVRGEQHLGLDLAEAVHHPVETEIRAAGGPDRAQAGGGQHGHHGLGDVGHETGHPVAGLHPHGP